MTTPRTADRYRRMARQVRILSVVWAAIAVAATIFAVYNQQPVYAMTAVAALVAAAVEWHMGRTYLKTADHLEGRRPRP